jgi:hypothetical protein
MAFRKYRISLFWRKLKRGEDDIMNRRILMVIGALIALNGASIAQADEALKFRIVSHVSSAQIDNVGDVEGHVLLVARQEGIAFLQDGSVAGAILTATSDYTNGAGTFVAYWNLTLDDPRPEVPRRHLP